jgi:hypothetical protein
MWMSAGAGREVQSPNSCLCSDSSAPAAFIKWANPNPAAPPADQCPDIPYSSPSPAVPPAREHTSASSISLFPWQKAAMHAVYINIRHKHICFIFFGKSMRFAWPDCVILKKILQIFLFFKMKNKF